MLALCPVNPLQLLLLKLLGFGGILAIEIALVVCLLSLWMGGRGRR
jgi:hypothetical protein